MLKRFRRDTKSCKGQSLLEFALVIPVLCIIFMGIFDFGLLMHKQITLDNATRSAARRAAVGATTEATLDLVHNSVYFPLGYEDINVQVLNTEHVDIFDNTDRTPDNYVVVEAMLYDVQLVTPLRNLVDSMCSVHLNSRAEFLIE